MTDPVSIHLKDLDIWEDLVLKQVVELQVGAEGGPLGVEGDGPDVGDVAAMYRCLHITYITDERIYGGVHQWGGSVQLLAGVAYQVRLAFDLIYRGEAGDAEGHAKECDGIGLREDDTEPPLGPLQYLFPIEGHRIRG